MNLCFLVVLRSGDESYMISTAHEEHHSPQGGKRCAARRGGIYVVDAIVGESSVHQDRLVFVLIGRGDQSVRTRTTGVMVPVELHGRCEKRGTTQAKCETQAGGAGKMWWKHNARERERAPANLQLPMFLLCHLCYLLVGIQVRQMLDTRRGNVSNDQTHH